MSNNDEMQYPRSGMPDKGGEPSKPVGPRTDQAPIALRHHDPLFGDRVAYVSLELQGMEVVEWPLMHSESSVQKVTKVQVREIPDVISAAIEAGLRDGNAPAVLGHYSGCLLGSKLLTPKGEARMQELVRGLADSTNRERYIENEVKPFLNALRVKAR